MTEQVMCKWCDKPIFLATDGVLWFDHTGDLPALCTVSKSFHEPVQTAERPEQTGEDEHDCAKCGRSVNVADGCEFNGKYGDMCWTCLANNYEALKQSHAALMEALKDMKSGWTYIREVYGDLYGVGWDRAEILAKEALANAKKIAEGL